MGLIMLPQCLEFPLEASEHVWTVIFGLSIHTASRFGGFFCFKNRRECFLQVVFLKERSINSRTASEFVWLQSKRVP